MVEGKAGVPASWTSKYGLEICFIFLAWLLGDRPCPASEKKAFGAAFRHLLSEFQVKLSVRLEDVAYMKTFKF